MDWTTSPIVLRLIDYMQSRGCEVSVLTRDGTEVGLGFSYGGKQENFLSEDIQTALDYAYRIEWEPHAIGKRFADYLISIHKTFRNATNN